MEGEGGLLSKLCLLPCFILSLMQYILASIMKGVAKRKTSIGKLMDCFDNLLSA